MRRSFEQTGSDVGAFGEHLRREREIRGITLDEIAAGTKIGTRLLRALEEEQFDLLPGGIFNKGYVRAYAKYIGVDEEQAVAEYLKAANQAHLDVQSTAQPNSSTRGDAARRGMSEVTQGSGFPLVPVLVLLVVLLGAAGAWHLYQQRQQEGQHFPRARDVAGLEPSSAARATNSTSSGNAGLGQTGAAATESPPETARVSQSLASSPGAANTAVHTVEAAENSPHSSGSGAPAGASAETGALGSKGTAPFEVTVRAKDRARVEIKSDGKVLVSGVMNPSEVKTVHATSKVVFWTGNAGEVELSFNGKDVPLNGGENDEQLLVFDAHGLMPRPAAQ